jgi:cyanate permease
MLLGTVALAYMSNATSAFSLLLASAMYGVTIGNLTTLSPLIARREFGAVSFGSIYGLIAAAIAFATAFGPAIFGLLRDSLGSYGPPLLMFAGINLIAAGIIVWGGRKPMPQPS